jgi:hypothetical protein
MSPVGGDDPETRPKRCPAGHYSAVLGACRCILPLGHLGKHVPSNPETPETCRRCRAPIPCSCAAADSGTVVDRAGAASPSDPQLHPALPEGRPGEPIATMDEADCISCEQGEQGEDVCPDSPRPCRHHCNHSWSHELCCYCKREWGEG